MLSLDPSSLLGSLGTILRAQGQTPKSRNGNRRGWPNDSSKSGSLRLDLVCVCVCVCACVKVEG